MVKIYLINVSKINQQKFRNNTILITSSTYIIAAALVFIGYNLFISDLYSIIEWNAFFLFCLIFSCSAFVCLPLLKYLNTGAVINRSIKKGIKTNQGSQKGHKFPRIFPLILIMMFNFLFFADDMYLSQLPSWINNKFGNQSFIIYINSAFPMILITTIAGNYISKWLNERYSKEKSNSFITEKIILMVCLLIYLVCLNLITVSNFIIFYVLWYFIILFIANIHNTTIGYLMTELAIKGNSKYKTMKYLVQKLPVYLADLIFYPIGVYLSLFITIEDLMRFTTFILILSLLSLYFLKKNSN